MSDRLLIAEAYLDGMETKYKHFKLVEKDKIIKRYNRLEDKEILKKAKEYNKRINSNLKEHIGYTKDQSFIDYVDKYVNIEINKNNNTKRKPVFKYKWPVFISTAALIMIASLGSKNKGVSAGEQTTEPVVIESTTEENNTEEVIPVYNEENPTITPTTDITTDTNTNEEEIINSTIVNSNFEDIFQYSSENIWTDYHDYVVNNYGTYLDKYCPMYGMDKELAIAIISQENPTNSKLNTYAHGPAQEENVHANEKLYCYNHVTGQTDGITIDLNRIDTDMDYAMQVFVMTFMDNANYLYPKINFNISDSQFIDIVTDAYNKGKYGVETSILNSNSYEEVINANHNLSGDYYYRSNIYKHLKDGTEISITTNDGVTHSAIFDNTNVDEYLVDSNKEIKAMAR